MFRGGGRGRDEGGGGGVFECFGFPPLLLVNIISRQMIYLITTIRMSTAAVTVMKMMIAELFLASSSSSSAFDVMTVLNPQAGGC